MLHLLAECWYFYLGKDEWKPRTRPRHSQGTLPCLAVRGSSVLKKKWMSSPGILLLVLFEGSTHLIWNLAVSLGWPVGFLTFLSSVTVSSTEKILGNVQLLHVIVGFRTKPGTLNHISPFILTVQTLTTGKAVPNIFNCSLGWRKRHFCLNPPGCSSVALDQWGKVWWDVWSWGVGPKQSPEVFNAPLCVSTVNMTFVKTLL